MWIKCPCPSASFNLFFPKYLSLPSSFCLSLHLQQSICLSSGNEERSAETPRLKLDQQRPVPSRCSMHTHTQIQTHTISLSASARNSIIMQRGAYVFKHIHTMASSANSSLLVLYRVHERIENRGRGKREGQREEKNNNSAEAVQVVGR